MNTSKPLEMSLQPRLRLLAAQHICTQEQLQESTLLIIDLLYANRISTLWDSFIEKWIVVDLRQQNLSDCRLSLLWLLCLAQHQNRCLVGLIDSETDLSIVRTLEDFHTLNGRSLCISEWGIEQLIEQGSKRNLCWVSSPTVIGPALIKHPIPLICLSCREKIPIKHSWLTDLGESQFFEQLKNLRNLDPEGMEKLSNLDILSTHHIQLITCTYGTEDHIDRFLEHSEEWLIESAADGLEILHSFIDVNPGLYIRRCLLNALSKREGFLLECANDPGLYGSWNAIIELSEEEFISNANPDDLRSPEQLRCLVKALQAHPERLVASSVVVPIQQSQHLKLSFSQIKGLYHQRWFKKVEDGYGLSSLYFEPEGEKGPIEAHNVPHCSPVWRRRIHQVFGLFNEQRYGSQADWALWCNYAYYGGRFCHSDQCLSGYFINTSSYGRKQLSSAGYRLIISDFLRRIPLKMDRKRLSFQDRGEREPSSWHICIHGLNSYYGDHRNSNNSILNSLVDLHDDQAELKFIWFIEGYFIWGEVSGERRSGNFRSLHQPWFGVLHIPPLTPKWAGNQFAELFFLKEWKKSLGNCRGLISLSTYMANDLKLIYPHIPIFNLKHPIAPFAEKFNLKSFLDKPRVVLIGYWLRRHHRFYRWRSPLEKLHLLKKYTLDHMSWEEQRFGPLTAEELASVTRKAFMPPDAYDCLLRNSLIYLSMYETSGNNSVIECISMGTPFIADRHPAIEEYVGRDYPLLLDEGELERLNRNDLIERATEAHHYLMEHPSLANDLSYSSFKQNITSIIKSIEP